MSVILVTLTSPVVKIVVKKLFSVASAEFVGAFGLKKDIERLKSTLTNIQQLAERLEENSLSPPTQNWLEEIQVAAYDAEDLIESWATEYQHWKKQVHKVHFPFSANNSVFLVRESHKLKKVTKTIDKLITQGQAFSTIAGHTTLNVNRFPEDTFESHVIISRDDDEEKIIKLLITDEEDDHDHVGSQNLSFVPILGMGGLGKTTIAQVVCGTEWVKNYFNNCICWVTVTKIFDMSRVLKEIVLSLLPRETPGDDINSLLFYKLQDCVLESLEGKRFLLVLDDLWNHESQELEPLLKALSLGAKGSKVLVTSRVKEVLRITGSKTVFYLGYLGENESWELFSKLAFNKDDHEKESDSEGYENYGREIVRKCQGLPLALKQMGGLLRWKDLGVWKSIANSKTWHEKDRVLPALKFSYNSLHSSFHKQCFSYCSMFPKAYAYEKDEVVKIWMAQSLIEPSDEERTEDTGSRYFKELSDRFFFEPISADVRHDTKYKMHDLIHDLAQLVSSPFCCQLVKGVVDFKEKARHVSLVCEDADQPTLEIIKRSKKLRTLLLPGQHLKDFELLMKREIFHSLKYVRLLDLSSTTALTQLPDSIGKLRLVRYLDLSETEVEKLPDSLCSLYNLETLKLLGCRNWNFILPKNFKYLVNLRHFEVDDMFWHNVLTFPPRVGCLTNLHNLHKFQVGCQTGYKLEEMENMDHLTGKVHISKLENAVDSRNANLKRKEKIQKLEYEWSSSDLNLKDEATENKVLEDLEPHPKELQELRICHFRGTEFPAWMRVDDKLVQFRNLVSICLNHCTRIKTLSLGKLPKLRTLRLKNMLQLEEWKEEETMNRSIVSLKMSECPKLKKMPFFFLNLTALNIKKCDSLERIPWGSLRFMTLVDNAVLKHWSAEDRIIPIVAYVDEQGHTQDYVTLTKDMINVKIVNCPELEVLPRHLYPQKLELRGCKSLSSLPDDGHAVRLSFLALDACHEDLIKHVPRSTTGKLLSLEISNTTSFIRLPKLPRLPSVQTLFIRGCEHLKYLSDRENRVFESSTSLQSLIIQNCRKLVTLPVEGLPISLQFLSIVSCDSLKSFGPSADVLKNLTSLCDLYIEDCPALLSLPDNGLPTCLQHLSIKGCPSLIARCAKEDGPDWPKIQDISDLEIEKPQSSSIAWYNLPARLRGHNSKGKAVLE